VAQMNIASAARGGSIWRMTTTRKIRWGSLGYAKIAWEHLIPAIQRSANSEFHAVASRDKSKLDECRAKFKTPNLHLGYDELVRDPEVDAVYIPLPNSQHREWALKAAERGKHILCEKPIAMNAAECRDMMAVAKANGVLLMEAFMYRYTDRTRKVLEVLRSGTLGDITFISSSFRYLISRPNPVRLKPELGGGALYDVGCYPVNFTGMVMDEVARLKTGKPDAVAPAPESISVRRIDEDGVDMNLSAIVKYPGGVLASLNCGFTGHLRLFSEIAGTRGVLEVPVPFFDNPGNLALTVNREAREIAVEKSDRYRHEVEDFADAILSKREPQLKMSETLRNMEMLDRLYAAK